jgi:predicted Fe-Mo cluster-binding NifX family protein
VKIAVPVVDGRFSAHFGETKFFAVAEVDWQRRAIVSTQIFPAPPHEPGSLPRWLRGQGVQILVVGNSGIGRRALDYLVHHGIEAFAGQPEATVETLVADFLEGRLPQTRGGCDEQHESAAKDHDCRLAAYFERQPDGN